MKHYCTQLIKSQIFHCRIFIEYLRNCSLKAKCLLQILPPAHVFTSGAQWAFTLQIAIDFETHFGAIGR